MKRAIVSAAGPSMASILECSEPTFAHYAEAHGYELIVKQYEQDHTDYHHPASRAARWAKLDVVESALHDHELAVWMDADTMFTKFDRDIADDLPKDCFQAFALEQASHRYTRGFNPNSGVWIMRQDPESLAFIAKVREIGQVATSSWTDQAAISVALGWEVAKVEGINHIKPVQSSPFLRRTGWLPFEWNPVGLAKQWPSRVLHFAGMKNEERLPLMQAELERLQESGV